MSHENHGKASPVSHDAPLQPILQAHSPGGMQFPLTHSVEHWKIELPFIGAMISMKSSTVECEGVCISIDA